MRPECSTWQRRSQSRRFGTLRLGADNLPRCSTGGLACEMNAGARGGQGQPGLGLLEGAPAPIGQYDGAARPPLEQIGPVEYVPFFVPCPVGYR
jgi:hypothetical protein